MHLFTRCKRDPVYLYRFPYFQAIQNRSPPPLGSTIPRKVNIFHVYLVIETNFCQYHVKFGLYILTFTAINKLLYNQCYSIHYVFRSIMRLGYFAFRIPKPESVKKNLGLMLNTSFIYHHISLIRVVLHVQHIRRIERNGVSSTPHHVPDNQWIWYHRQWWWWRWETRAKYPCNVGRLKWRLKLCSHRIRKKWLTGRKRRFRLKLTGKNLSYFQTSRKHVHSSSSNVPLTLVVNLFRDSQTKR